jgi:hypothetical protein
MGHARVALPVSQNGVKAHFGPCNIFLFVLSSVILLGAHMAEKTTAEVKVRMPKSLHRRIQREANRRGQTINAEILRRLELADEHQSELKEVATTVAEIQVTLRQAVESIKEQVIRRATEKAEKGVPVGIEHLKQIRELEEKDEARSKEIRESGEKKKATRKALEEKKLKEIREFEEQDEAARKALEERDGDT